MKTCPVCKKQFENKQHPNVRFCSYECSTKQRPTNPNKTTTYTCKYCGQQFLAFASQLRTYCSVECKRAAQFERTHMHYSCAFCGKECTCYKSRPLTYCSKECEYKAHVKPETHTTYVCKNCKSEFSGYTFVSRQFCSNKCMRTYLRGANHPFYRGGTTSDRGDNWHNQRLLALRRDNFTCQGCGKKQTRTYRLHIHHIIPYHTFNGDWLKANELHNLISLCRSCHRKMEAKRE